MVEAQFPFHPITRAASQAASERLAGRASMLALLPFSMAELQVTNGAPASVNELIYTGFSQPIDDRPIEPNIWI